MINKPWAEQPIYLASDHAGFKLKEKIKKILIKNKFNITDCGPHHLDPNDDYPDIISKAASSVSKKPNNSRAIIFGGSGQAEAIVANKFKGIRCVLFYAPVIPYQAADITGRKSKDPLEMIRLTREHNNANVLSIGARFVQEEIAIKAIKLWLETPFTQDSRHVRRIKKIAKLEIR